MAEGCPTAGLEWTSHSRSGSREASKSRLGGNIPQHVGDIVQEVRDRTQQVLRRSHRKPRTPQSSCSSAVSLPWLQAAPRHPGAQEANSSVLQQGWLPPKVHGKMVRGRSTGSREPHPRSSVPLAPSSINARPWAHGLSELLFPHAHH